MLESQTGLQFFSGFFGLLDWSGAIGKRAKMQLHPGRWTAGSPTAITHENIERKIIWTKPPWGLMFQPGCKDFQQKTQRFSTCRKPSPDLEVCRASHDYRPNWPKWCDVGFHYLLVVGWLLVGWLGIVFSGNQILIKSSLTENHGGRKSCLKGFPPLEWQIDPQVTSICKVIQRQQPLINGGLLLGV